MDFDLYDSDIEEEYNSFGDEEGEDDSLGDAAGGEVSVSTVMEPLENKAKYRVLSLEQVREKQDAEIQNISSMLSVSRSEAITLLRNFRWDCCRATEHWFGDEDKMRKLLGLFSGHFQTSGNKGHPCQICYEQYTGKKSLFCGHGFCEKCWGRYVSVSIKDGPGCLALKCPQPKCHAVVGEDMILSLTLDEEHLKERYSDFLVRSYIEERVNTKWCPSPGCVYAVELDFNENSNTSYDIACKCCYTFCWKCTEETHRPVDCETVRKWLIKNSSEAENTSWILANTKQCPKCLRQIEKGHGCMHMTCFAPCNHEFCWLCMSDWQTHDTIACHRYEVDKEDGKTKTFAEENKKREMARRCLEKYVHYYERWQGNDNSRKRALEDLGKLESEFFQELSKTLDIPRSKFNFVTRAWQQIVECRKVLKWTYTYGYYLSDDVELVNKQLFEYLQGQAESLLERLHHCTEIELKGFMTRVAKPGEFGAFEEKLLRLTSVTGTHFDNLVLALENSLRDVNASA